MTSKGSKKTQLKIIQGEDAQELVFSKRRSSLFKKASELCTLCSIEMALVIFSPGGKAITFGYPDVKTIINWFINGEKLDFGSIQRCQADHEATLRELKKQYSDIHKKVKFKKQQGYKLKQMLEGQEKGWWNIPINDLNLNELESLMVKFEDLYRKVLKQIDKATTQTSPQLQPQLPANSVGVVNPSLSIPAEGSTSANPHGHGVSYGD